MKLSVEANVTENQLHLREGIAAAELIDRKIELALNVDGAVLVTVYSPDGKTWRTYGLTPRALIDAVLIKDRKKW